MRKPWPPALEMDDAVIADRMSDLYNGAVRAKGNRDAMLMELRTLAKKAPHHLARAYAPLFQGLRTTFSCVFEGFSRELSSHYIINTNCNALYSPIHYRKVANM